MKYLIIISLFFLLTPKVFGGEVVNNKFGIHLAQPNPEDIRKAAKLVNSSGGKWGYITLVIQENDRDKRKWQDIFDVVRESHLIPLIRLATTPEGANWKKPAKESVESWVQFLDSLNWVVKERYIILFNEPNHATEWGGRVDPEDYAETVKLFAQKLREKNKDFFVMMAGFDASAPSAPSSYESEDIFLRRIFYTIGKEDFNTLFSGWVSHSYPNPGFAGSPDESGRGTVRTYQWELDLLEELGASKLPVFITETGWDGRRISEEQIASYYENSFQSVWLPDNQIHAVTPFVFSYLDEPFANFSWVKPDNDSYYPSFYTVQSLPKDEGSPEIIEAGEMRHDFPHEIVVQSSYNHIITLKNMGQAIWDKADGYYISVDDTQLANITVSDVHEIKPGTEGVVNVNIKTNKKIGKDKIKIRLMRKNSNLEEKKLLEKEWSFNMGPLPRLEFKMSLYPKLKTEMNDVELQIFNEKEELVFDKKNLKISKRKGIVDGVSNVIVGGKHRVVVLKQYYLPRQEYLVFQKNTNKVEFPVMLPLDFNRDGAFSYKDMQVLIGNINLLSLWMP